MQIQKIFFSIRNLYNIDIDLFREDSCDRMHDRNLFRYNFDPDSIIIDVSCSILEVLDFHCPLKTVSSNRKKINPWFTREISELIKEKIGYIRNLFDVPLLLVVNIED